ncbi:MAG: hypothetical protein OXP69_03810 [Spirochaetaceae bacterium]|nr:hypothetical protein [Spirochaetaceae bacterium]
MDSKDEQPTPDADSVKAAQLGRLKALANEISPEHEAELEAKYSARSRSIREAGKRLVVDDQKLPKARRRPSAKAKPPRGRGHTGVRPVRRKATPRTEGPDPDSPGAKELAVLAKAIWADTHNGAECPPNHIPTPHNMASWWPWPEDLIKGLFAWLTERAGPDPLTFEAVAPELKTRSDEPLMHVAVAELRKRLSDADLDRLHLVTRYGPLPLRAALEAAQRIGMADLAATDAGLLISTLSLLVDSSSSSHPLASLVDAWQRDPRKVNHETRADRRIMPALRVVGPPPERERGILFGGLVDDRPRSAELSLFPELEPTQHRVPLLEIVDRTGVPIRSQGRGAPLEARLLVRGGLLMIRPEDRHLATVRIAVTVGELLDGLWPPRRDKRGMLDRHTRRNWPKLLDALYRARDWTVPDPRGGRWFPMALRRLPPSANDGDTPALDELVVIDLAPVPGAVSGASVDLPSLDRMGVTSGPRWRAYIAGRSLIWAPGTTRRPVPGTEGERFGWSHNPDDYPVLMLDDLRRHAFGDHDAKNRTRASILAPWQDLPDLTMEEATEPRTGVSGWRLLPTDRPEHSNNP